MSEHPNVTAVNRMTQAALAGDQKAQAPYFTEDLAFRVRGTLPATGDHRGVSGFLGSADVGPCRGCSASATSGRYRRSRGARAGG